MSIDNHETSNLSCGVPFNHVDKVVMAHGGGGRMMQQLIGDVFFKAFANPMLATAHDSAVMPFQTKNDSFRLAYTTDSYVVRPLFFPGGDIGKLAICGTVNDLSMSGAKPLYLSMGVILEEGFPIADLQRIVDSMQRTARACGVQIVTGDTKVVERGKGDGIYINTSGVGLIEHAMTIDPSSVRAGDAVLLSGDIGRHGIAIMAVREGLDFETTIESDCAPLSDMVQDLLKAGVEVHCLRDVTRGGVASALNEIAAHARCAIEIDETKIPVEPQVRGACELLGLDPVYVANEGRLVAFVPQHSVSQALAIMHKHEVGKDAVAIGTVSAAPARRVSIKNSIGITRLLDMLSGEQLPRIC